MSNVAYLTRSGQVKPMSVFPYKLFDERHCCLELSTELAKLNISDYKIVIVDHPYYDVIQLLNSINETKIIIVYTDHLHHTSFPFNGSSTHLVSQTVKTLIDAAERFTNKTISFVCLVANLDRELDQVTLPANLSINYTSAGNLAYNIERYSRSELIIDKQYNLPKHFICLNNRARIHRTALVAYLLGQGLDQTGNISFIENNSDVNDFTSWCVDAELHKDIKECIQQGVDRMQTIPLLDLPIMSNRPMQSITSVYRSAFVEIISDTTYFEASAFLNDKFVNNLYGAAFPIFISSSGTVAQLRLLGFDMFDDIVNHNYDSIDDPVIRMQQAIQLNREILTNGNLAKELWNQHSNRFIANQHYYQNQYKLVAKQIQFDLCTKAISGLKLK
jgi:hypothetical protein